VFFGTLGAVVCLGAFVPLTFGRETVGHLETIATEAEPARLAA
jgi:hypothetical protein